MSNDIIHTKIELLEEQIENIERSGHFTEKEINRLSSPLREELESLKKQLNLYGMNQEKYNEGVKMHRHYFSQMYSPALVNTCKLFGMKLTSIQG
jgi:hypothetical protein